MTDSLKIDLKIIDKEEEQEHKKTFISGSNNNNHQDIKTQGIIKIEVTIIEIMKDHSVIIMIEGFNNKEDMINGINVMVNKIIKDRIIIKIDLLKEEKTTKIDHIKVKGIKKILIQDFITKISLEILNQKEILKK